MKKTVGSKSEGYHDRAADAPLIEVLKRTIAREEAKIERARQEIWKCELELLELGVELPLQE